MLFLKVPDQELICLADQIRTAEPADPEVAGITEGKR